MKRLMTGFGVAAAFGLVASLSAQTPTTSASQTSNDHEVTITGCLERGANGNYTLTNARADNGMAGSATTTTGTSGTTATGTTSATGTTAGAMNAAAGSTWALEGGSDLDKHVGHKIQVTGKEVSSKDKDEASATTTATGATTTATGTTGTTGTTGEASEQRHSTSVHASHTLDVKSVKMISSSCS
jgi:hypothetical protein